MHVSRPAIAAAVLFTFSGCLPVAGGQSTAGGGSDHADAIRREQNSSLGGPLWFDPSGAIKAQFALATVRNKCSKPMEIKLVEDTPDGPSCGSSECEKTISPWPAHYEFWSITGFPQLAQLALVAKPGAALHVMLRHKYDGKEHPWIISDVKVETARWYALEIASDCKTVKPRTGEPLHGCYKWHYSQACGIRQGSSIGPDPEVACKDGSRPAVEGMPGEQVCSFETPTGTCRIRASTMETSCLRR